MLAPLRNPTYRRLFGAQILSLIGTGLATVALGLLAFDLAGADAGVVLGTALAIKMICYVGVAPVATAFTHLLPRRSLLVALDLVRAAVVALLPFVTEIWQVYLLIALLLPLWAWLGFGNGLVLTPTGRLLRRSAQAGDRPALFAAQFALSHACWLVTYPLAGWLGATAGMAATFTVMAALAAAGVALAASLWPRHDPEAFEHEHAGLPHDHPHLGAQAVRVAPGRFRHRHAVVVDREHPRWPRPTA